MNVYFIYVMNSVIAVLVYADAMGCLKFRAAPPAPRGKKMAMLWAGMVWLCWPVLLPAYFYARSYRQRVDCGGI